MLSTIGEAKGVALTAGEFALSPPALTAEIIVLGYRYCPPIANTARRSGIVRQTGGLKLRQRIITHAQELAARSAVIDIHKERDPNPRPGTDLAGVGAFVGEVHRGNHI